MVGHDIGDVLENFQILNRDLGIVVCLALVGGLQLGEVFEDVSFELDPVEPWNGSGGTEAHLRAADVQCFLKHGAPPYCSVVTLSSGFTSSSGIYTDLYQF